MPDDIVEAQVGRLTLEIIETLPHDMCTICRLRFVTRDYVVGVSCSHGLHLECFRPLIENVSQQERVSQVPNCRRPVNGGRFNNHEGLIDNSILQSE